MLKNTIINPIMAAALGAGALLTGCATPSNNYAYDDTKFNNLDYEHEVFSEQGENSVFVPNKYYISGQEFDLDSGIGQLSRIEWANLAKNMTSISTGDEHYISQIKKPSGSTKQEPVRAITVAHEDSSNNKNDQGRGFQKHLNQFSYEPRNYTSVANDLPAGWVQLDGAILHQNSGLVCQTSMDTQDTGYTLTLTRLHQFDAKDLDVACSYESNTGAFITLYASYYPDLSQEDHAILAARHIRDRFNPIGTLPVPVVEISTDSGEIFETPSAVGYDISQKNSDLKLKTSLWVVKTGDWHVKARATHRQNDSISEITAVSMFAVAHITIKGKNGGSNLDELDV